MRLIAIIFLLCPLLFGCSTNQYLRSPLDANHRRTQERTEIVLRSGDRIYAVDIKVGLDTTQYVLIGTDSVKQIGTKEIDRFIVTDHIAGGFGGFMAGSVGGLGGGIAFGALILNSPDKSSGGEQAWNIFCSGLGGLIIGSIGGTIYGVMHSPQDNYIFPIDSVHALNKRSACNLRLVHQ